MDSFGDGGPVGVKRSTRMEVAKKTVEVAERGWYTSPGGCRVEIASAVRNCLDATRLFSPTELKRLRNNVLANSAGAFRTAVEVVNETTLAGVARLLADGDGPVAALNFASAKNPGGGFLNGSQAQEESLARSSALYASLLRAWDFYEQHRASPSLLYSDAMILSPGCPVFRDDEGALLAEPLEVAFITSAAPNAGATANSRPDELCRPSQMSSAGGRSMCWRWQPPTATAGWYWVHGAAGCSATTPHLLLPPSRITCGACGPGGSSGWCSRCWTRRRRWTRSRRSDPRWPQTPNRYMALPT